MPRSCCRSAAAIADSPGVSVRVPLLALLLAMAAPEAAAIRGVVREQGSLEPIAGATVRIPDLRRIALTDARGYFVLADVPAGRWRVVASALGHREHE